MLEEDETSGEFQVTITPSSFWVLRDPMCSRDDNSLVLPTSFKAARTLVQHGFSLSSPSPNMQHLLWGLRDHP